MSTPTPETDKLQDFMPVGTVWLEHSRSLERERDESRAALSGRTVSCSLCNESAKKIAQLTDDLESGFMKGTYARLKELQGKERDLEKERERADSKHALWVAELRKVTELETQIQAMREAIKEAHTCMAFIINNHNLDGEAALEQAGIVFNKLKPFITP